MRLAATRPTSLALAVLGLGAILAAASWPAPAGAQEPRLPIVFVHGGSGSAAQYETQARRFASNDYPNVVRGIDRTSSNSATLNPQLDAFFDAVMAETGDTQIYVLAHSLGTGLMNNYLNSDPARAARVMKYVSLDGAPANCGSIPTVCTNITSTTVSPPNQQGHTQTVTSPESFVLQYQFLTGETPQTTLILPEANPEISGRIINFPFNNGVDGATVELWEVDGTTGYRTNAMPVATFTTGPDGNFGPVPIDGTKHHEFFASNPASTALGHYHYQPFLRSDHLIRLLSSQLSVTATPSGPDHSAMVNIRYQEWWSDHPTQSDSVAVHTTSPAWDDDPTTPSPPPLNVLQLPNVAPAPPAFGNGQKIGLHLHDIGIDKVSSLAPIPDPILTSTFQTRADIWMPATEPPDGTVSVTSTPRNDASKIQIVNVPNWASSLHRIVVQWNDYQQDSSSFPPTLPGNKDELKCQTGTAKELGKFAKAKAKCVDKCVKAARKGDAPSTDCVPPYGGATATCIQDPLKGAEAKARGKIGKACQKDCPDCYDAAGNCPDGATFVTEVEGQVDAVGPLVYCVEAGGAVPTKQEAKCEDGVAKNLVKLVESKSKCVSKCVTNAFNGKIPDVGACEADEVTDPDTVACIAKASDKAATSIDKACAPPSGAIPACHLQSSGADWVGLEAVLDLQAPETWCGPTTTTVTVSTTTTTTTTTTSSTTTTSTTEPTTTTTEPTTTTTTTSTTTTTTMYGSPSRAFLTRPVDLLD